ncbi:DUF6266 family protein [Paraflavitalea pollutisoli]|uniref:DUF6266 family protein n=1 Tax=Paraflavitalea pollutisoli TaxID=3034143 RepID=UPI0023EDF5D7|nr:DUF6266 family protein [Paraflavitalea sp. H1-2-19X]
MGRIAKGVLGGFSGTVGSVVGGNWKGIEYIRSKPVTRKGRKQSQKQLEQQAKFATAIRFTRTIQDLFMETFTKNANLMTGINSAISDLLKRALIGTYPFYDILYSQVMISRGSLPNAASAQAVAASAGGIQFNWGNMDIPLGKAGPKDQALLVAYCPELNRAWYRKGVTRIAMTDTLDASGLSGKTVQTWLTFISEDKRDLADSLFTGEVTVA